MSLVPVPSSPRSLEIISVYFSKFSRSSSRYHSNVCPTGSLTSVGKTPAKSCLLVLGSNVPIVLKSSSLHSPVRTMSEFTA